jgi:hypothetical protein
VFHVRYELGFYIPEDTAVKTSNLIVTDILQTLQVIQFKAYITGMWGDLPMTYRKECGRSGNTSVSNDFHDI